jgi:histidinol-phosphate aminotransferase
MNHKELNYHFREDVWKITPRTKQSKKGLLNLSNNELVHPLINNLFLGLMSSVNPETIRTYPYYPSIIKEFAKYFQVGEDQILITAGSDDGIKIITEAIMTTTGRVILQEPNFENYPYYSGLLGVKVTSVRCSSAYPYIFTKEQFEAEAKVVPPSVIVISNPNGITGFCFSLEEMADLSKTCELYNHLLIIDEAYVPFNGFDHLSLLKSHENVILIRSFSKSLGLAGLRIGAVFAAPIIIDYLARWNSANPVSGVAIEVLSYFLKNMDTVNQAHQDIIRCREWFSHEVIKKFSSWLAIPSQANLLSFDTRNPKRVAEVTEFLRNNRILIRDLSGIQGLTNCLRFTIGNIEVMNEVINVLSDYQEK